MRRFVRNAPKCRNWKIPKVAGMSAYSAAIREFGNAGVPSTAPGVATHKDIKKGVAFTNRHDATFVQQV